MMNTHQSRTSTRTSDSLTRRFASIPNQVLENDPDIFKYYACDLEIEFPRCPEEPAQESVAQVPVLKPTTTLRNNSSYTMFLSCISWPKPVNSNTQVFIPESLALKDTIGSSALNYGCDEIVNHRRSFPMPTPIQRPQRTNSAFQISQGLMKATQGLRTFTPSPVGTVPYGYRRCEGVRGDQRVDTERLEHDA
ncbi:hypothetical protein K474DRAFT_756716 [Panus rudis PR-1116 ss-1]|nr:hypothetical protein K474DRAFT_756716 [Panus rudis PR-1116 ss-1]